MHCAYNRIVASGEGDGAQLLEHDVRRVAEQAHHLQHQGALGAEALHQRAGRHARLFRNRSQRQLGRPNALHYALRSGKNVLIADFARSCGHAS